MGSLTLAQCRPVAAEPPKLTILGGTAEVAVRHDTTAEDQRLMVDPNAPYQPGHGYPVGYPPPQHGYGLPPLASWGLRFSAGVVDLLLFSAGWVFLLGLPIAALAVLTDQPNPGYITGYTVGRLYWLGAPLFWLVFGFFDGRGGTPGKRIFGLRVLRENDAQPITVGLGIGRKCLWALNSLCCLGFLWPLWDGRNQTLADKVVNTVVVRYG